METAKKLQLEEGWWLSWYQDPPVDTRGRILFAAFREVHLNGFQAASIQDIIQSAGVTKGALYHYFSSKDEIGLALLDEIFSKYVENTFVRPLADTEDPITALIDFLQDAGNQMSEEDVALGCPLDHFADEMAPINPDFQTRIDGLFSCKQQAMVSAFERGQQAGNVRIDVPAETMALTVRAMMQGCMSMAKTTRSLDTLMQCGQGMFFYLEQLRPPLT